MLGNMGCALGLSLCARALLWSGDEALLMDLEGPFGSAGGDMTPISGRDA